MASLEAEQPERTNLVEATFKGTRLINGHSIETRKKGVMDFIISHRFGTIDGGSYELYGLDQATIRLGLEYALTDILYFGVGRSSFEKTYDSFVKYRVLQQSTGKRKIPISATWFSSISAKTLKEPEGELEFKEKLAFTHQILLARKLNNAVSLQLSPTWVHKNLIGVSDQNNDVYALGMGGRLKFSQRGALCVEYYLQFQQLNETTQVPLLLELTLRLVGMFFSSNLQMPLLWFRKDLLLKRQMSFSKEKYILVSISQEHFS